MKKTKLLTSLAALALVLGLGACEETEVEEPSDDTSSEATTEGGETGGESTPNEPDEDEATTIDELKFVVTLYVNDDADKVPEYGTLYYYGGFNGTVVDGTSYNGEYVKLEETTNSKNEVAYTYTFTDVPISEDHEFNILFYYEDEEVGSDFSTHALVSYQPSPVTKDTTSPVEYEVTLTESISEKFPDPSLEEELPHEETALDRVFAKIAQGNFHCEANDYTHSYTNLYSARVTPDQIELTVGWDTTGWLNDPDTGTLTPFKADGGWGDDGKWQDQLVATAAPDESLTVSDLIVSGSADYHLFEEVTDGWQLKTEGYTEEILKELLPDSMFIDTYKYIVEDSLVISVNDDEDTVNYKYNVNDDSGEYEVRSIVSHLGTAILQYENATYVPYEG